VAAHLGNDADVKRDALVDRDSLEPLCAAVAGQGVLGRAASAVLGLAGVSAEAGDGRAEDHEV